MVSDSKHGECLYLSYFNFKGLVSRLKAKLLLKEGQASYSYLKRGRPLTSIQAIVVLGTTRIPVSFSLMSPTNELNLMV